MVSVQSRMLCLLYAGAAILTLSACGHKETTTSDPPLTEAQKRALAHVAMGSGYEGKDNTRAIEEYQLALKEDPGNRQFMGNLAFMLHRAGRTTEAIPLWQSLAQGNDQYAQTANKWLVKVGAKPKE